MGLPSATFHLAEAEGRIRTRWALDIAKCLLVAFRPRTAAALAPAAPRSIHAKCLPPYHEPVLAMLGQGSAGGSASPACKISMEMPSGVRIKAIRPSRGGRLIVTPWAMKALQVS